MNVSKRKWPKTHEDRNASDSSYATGCLTLLQEISCHWRNKLI